MIVMKFGGTSIGNAERIINVANIIKDNLEKKPIVVVSSITKITDALIKLANESIQGKSEETFEFIKKTHYDILKELNIDQDLLKKDIKNLYKLISKIKSKKSIDAKILDAIQSFGEQMSSKILAAQLNKINVKARAFNSWEIGFITNSEFGNAEPLEITYSKIGENIKKLDVVPVITGFIGKTIAGDITTLGRGGSDYSATIIGTAINAKEIQIWSDVNGIMSGDPRIVNNPKTLENISFNEAAELAYFGAKVLHPKTILPSMNKNIPVRVLNSFNPKNNGTVIFNNGDKQAVKAIAYKKKITLININSTRMLGAYGFLAKIFDIFAKYEKSVDVISTSEVSVSLSIDNDKNINEILDELKAISNVNVERNKAIICIVGEGIKNTFGIIAKTFTAIENNKINIEMISQGASKINLTFIIDEKDSEKAVNILHNEYFS